MNLAYLGPKGSFTEEAALTITNKNNLVSSSSIEEVLDAVKKQSTDFGIVPVENSLQGIVIPTLDLILQKNLEVCGETTIPIKQNLLSKESSIKAIKTVYSHPHALAQVKGFLKKHLPNAEIKETSSTSYAAQIAAKAPGTGAIAGSPCAKLYSLNTLAKNIQDHTINITRFWLIKRKRLKESLIKAPYNTPTKTSCYIIIKDKVGALSELLDTFRQNHINLTSIQSRPLPESPWKYGFFIDLLVNANDPLASAMFKELKCIHSRVALFGTYPQLGVINPNILIHYNLRRIEKIFENSLKNIQLKKVIQEALAGLDKNINHKIKKILNTRLLIMPSVAQYKYQTKKPLEDKAREKTLETKLASYPQLQSIYRKLFISTKKLQQQIIQLLSLKTIGGAEIPSFPLHALRYYIDYIDSLTLYVYLNTFKTT